jgi:hypothetical protein
LPGVEVYSVEYDWPDRRLRFTMLPLIAIYRYDMIKLAAPLFFEATLNLAHILPFKGLNMRKTLILETF